MIKRMRAVAVLRFAWCLLGAALLGVSLPVQAQDASSESLYIVTYVEVRPGATDQAVSLLRQYREQARRAEGNLASVALQRIGRRNQFVILETWRNPAAQAAHAGTQETREFREALEPLQVSPYDEREHVALSVGSGAPGEAALYAVTHVDIVPTHRDTGIGLVRDLTERGRSAAGNLRFDALTQSSRTNHMTLVEAWSSQADQERHMEAAHTRHFRDGLLPLSGSLYDERLYAPLR